MKTNTTNTMAVYREIQKLAGSYFLGIPVCLIETCYREEFNRSLDYQSLGVRDIDELLERMGDMVVVFGQREINGKYVMPTRMAEMRQEVLLKGFVQKLLARHDGKIMFNSFEALYKEHYKINLPYCYYGLTNLENLCGMLKDILVVGFARGEKVIMAVKGTYNLRKRKR